MKKIITISLMLFLVASFSAFTHQPASTTDDKKKIEIAFTPSTGFTELVMIREKLAEKKIVLSYKKIEFNDQGELKAISFRVDCQDGFAGSATSENLSKSGKFGFFRDYTENASTPFGTGALK